MEVASQQTALFLRKKELRLHKKTLVGLEQGIAIQVYVMCPGQDTCTPAKCMIPHLKPNHGAGLALSVKYSY